MELHRLVRRLSSGYNSSAIPIRNHSTLGEATAMGREHLFDEFDWLSISRPRRLTIGDLMVGVALAAFGLFTLTTTIRSALNGGERVAFGILAMVLIGLEAAQWGIASIPCRRARPGLSTLLGILSFLVALATYIGLFVLAAAFPEGAAVVVIMMLVLVIYRTTWD
jgi:hypothetical protein